MLKITRLNRSGHEVECLIKLEDIEGVTEKEVADEPLYDACGNQVDVKKNDNIFKVYLSNGKAIYVAKATYDKLAAKLKVETL